MRNVKLAFRTLFKSPFVTSIAILSLALGIGANAAIYSLFDQILRRPLPVHEPHRLVNLSAPGPKPGSTSCNQAGSCDDVFSYPMFRDLEAAETALSGIAAHRLFGANVAYENQTLNGQGMMVSGSYFPLLGIQPARGRLLGPADDETIGGHYVAVLSYSYWETRLGADPNPVGRTIMINGRPFTIVGIAPRGFEGTTLGSRPLVFVPISMRGVLHPTFDGFEDRRNYWIYLFGRLKPGATPEQAAASLNAVYRSIINDVEAPLQTGMSDQTLAQFRAKKIVVQDGRRGQSDWHREARVPLLMLLATTGIVLLIACANTANLLLARGANRSLEMAVRLSIGAGRRHVIGQLLLESVVLALLGGVVSLLVARWTLAAVAAIMPPEAAIALQIELNVPVLLFTGGLSVLTGLLFGLFPALHSTRPNLVSTLRGAAGNLTGTRSAARFRSALVTAQIALSMALLVTAGLFIRSLDNISRVDLGMRVENVVTFTVSPGLNGYDADRSKLFFARLEEELAALPGVVSVTTAMVPVLAGNNWGTDVSVEGFERGPDTDVHSNYNVVGAGFFSTLGVQLLAGREFTLADNAGTANVAIVNEAFAEKFGLGRDAVGKRMAYSGETELDIEIVGLVRNAKYSEVKNEVPPVFYVPWRQYPYISSMSFYVHSTVDAAQIMRAIPQVVSRLDPNLPVQALYTMNQVVQYNVFVDRIIGMLSSTFAGLATLLAAIGLYGVLAYTVALRTREIGVRMALGANPGDVRRLVFRQVAIMLGIGGAIGLLGAWGLGRAAQSLLFELRGVDPLTTTAAAVTLTLFAFAAGFVPAHRAARVDPVRALRYE